ncbi:MAG: DedA family protein [Syntrophomonas sp.]
MFNLHLLHFISHYGYIAIAFLLAGGIFGFPIPDELLMIFSGYLVFCGHLKFGTTIIWAFIGSICGMSISYLIGKYVGLPALHRFGKHLGITEHRFAKFHQWFERFGKFAIPIGYFIPGIRQVNAFSSAVAEMSYREFAVYAYPGALLWVSVFVSLGWYLGKDWMRFKELFHNYEYIVAGAVLVALLFFVIQFIVRKDKDSPTPEKTLNS